MGAGSRLLEVLNALGLLLVRQAEIEHLAARATGRARATPVARREPQRGDVERREGKEV